MTDWKDALTEEERIDYVHLYGVAQHKCKLNIPHQLPYSQGTITLHYKPALNLLNTIKRLCGEVVRLRETLIKQDAELVRLATIVNADSAMSDHATLSRQAMKIRELEADLSGYQAFLVDYNEMKAKLKAWEAEPVVEVDEYKIERLDGGLHDYPCGWIIGQPFSGYTDSEIEAFATYKRLKRTRKYRREPGQGGGE